MQPLEQLYGLLCVGVPLALIVWAIVSSINKRGREAKERDRIEEISLRLQTLEAQRLVLIEKFSKRIETLESGILFLKGGKKSAPAPPPDIVVPAPVAQLSPAETILTAISPPPKPIVIPPPVAAPPPVITPLLPEAPVPPGMEEIAPGVFGMAATPQAPLPTVAPEAEPASNPPIITAKIESAPPPVAEKNSFEMRLGTYWLVRAGIVMLLTGLAFFANYAYHHIIGKLGPAGKISLLYAASGLLLGAGAWWQRRSAAASLKNYAQVLFAGGLAAVYFTTYAAHHILPLRVIESPLLDGTLLLAWAGVIMWIADRRKSEVMALFAVGLAFYSSVITRVGEFTLYSNLILTVAAVVFLVRNRWAGLSFASLATSYAGYTFWRFFHEDGWRWATPDENLMLGAGFLASYWLVFTAATFLSKSEKLSGQNRAAFLTLNNGAFFALFLLTMLQVHSGGFWKFSLGYGAVLLTLAIFAKKMLPDEPLAKNSYLTQGLLLVTLGFISKFAGLQLALVLGVESVVLFILGTQRQSVVLKFFAYAAALLATGWCVASLQPFVTRGLWTGLALGGFMSVNAFRAHRLEKDAASRRLETTAFTLLAFASWTAATWFNTLAPHLPVSLVLGIESIVLFNLVAHRQSLEPKIFAYFVAVISVGWCAANLKQFDLSGLLISAGLGAFMAINAFRAHGIEKNAASQRLETTAFTLLAFASWTAATWFNTLEPHLTVALVLGVESIVLFNLVARRKSVPPKIFAYIAAIFAVGWCVVNMKQFDSSGLWMGVALGALMIFNAYWAHRDTVENNSQPLRAEPSVFTLLALASWLATTWFNTSAENLPLALAVETVALTFSIYLLRVREITLLGQFFLVLAQGAWFVRFQKSTPPWWNPLAIIAVTIGLSHWWQKQKSLVVEKNFAVGCQAIFALAAVAMVLVWLHPLVAAPTWLALTSLLAVVATIYGVATRAWALAICGQIFLVVSAWEFFRQVWTEKPEWFFPLAPVAALGILSFATVGWFTRKPDSSTKVRDPLLQIALVYRWIALAMALNWLWQYVPDRQHTGAFMAVAIGVFAFAIRKRNREALVAAAIYAIVSLFSLWATEDLKMEIYWMNLLSLLALLAMQQILRRKSESFLFDEKIHGAIIFIAGVSLWRFVSCWAETFTGGFFLTMTWAGFAVLVFAAGMVLRERFHRWLGLVVLAAAVGRVVLVDVWKQETIYRVLTFMALGVALLVVGFIYNKFQDAIRKWL